MITFIATTVVDAECYIDLCQMPDGSLTTFVLEKTSEPNNFTEVESKSGDQMNQMVADYKHKRGGSHEVAFA